VSPVWQYADADPACVRSPELSCLTTRNCADESKAVYQAMAECLDLNLGELLNGMDPAVLDRTTIVFVGDNGTPSKVQESSFNQGSGRGKGSVYENGLRVPYIVADGATWRSGAAGVISSPGRTSSAPVHTTDLYATVLEAALGTPAATVDSRSFLGCFTDDSEDCGFPDTGGYAEQIAEENGQVSEASAAVRIGTDKMIFSYNVENACVNTKQFDLAADPFELTPLAAANQETDVLRDRFTSLYLGTSSWADGVPYCEGSASDPDDDDVAAPSTEEGTDPQSGGGDVGAEPTAPAEPTQGEQGTATVEPPADDQADQGDGTVPETRGPPARVASAADADLRAPAEPTPNAAPAADDAEEAAPALSCTTVPGPPMAMLAVLLPIVGMRRRRAPTHRTTGDS
jgi:Sulfatase